MPSTFSDNLLNKFPHISTALERKLWTCEQITRYFKRKAHLEQEISNMTAKLLAQTPKVLWFEESSMEQAWESLLKVEEENVKIHQLAAQQLDDRVHDQLTRTTESLAQSQKKVAGEGNNFIKLLNDSVTTLHKARDRYLRTCKEAEVLELTIKDIETDPHRKGELTKTEKKLTKTQEEASEDEAAYRQQLTSTNAAQDEYYKTSMPYALKEMEMLFTTRINKMKEIMKTFAEITQGTGLALTVANRMVEVGSDAINPESDILEYIQKNDSLFIVPSPFEFESYVKGGASAKKSWAATLRGRAGGSSAQSPASPVPSYSPNDRAPSSLNKDAVFHVSLEELMSRQQATHPEVPIPLILKFFCEGVMARNAFSTKGVFRISGSAVEIDEIKGELNRGIFKLPSDIHNICSLFKLWLRVITEPLIPSTLYDACMQLPSCESILSQLPELNRRCLEYIIAFLHGFLAPEVVAQTCMGVDNMGAIFGPCILRCPYEDLTMTLFAAEHEKQFVVNLLNTVHPTNVYPLSNFADFNWSMGPSPSPPVSSPLPPLRAAPRPDGKPSVDDEIPALAPLTPPPSLAGVFVSPPPAAQLPPPPVPLRPPPPSFAAVAPIPPQGTPPPPLVTPPPGKPLPTPGAPARVLPQPRLSLTVRHTPLTSTTDGSEKSQPPQPTSHSFAYPPASDKPLPVPQPPMEKKRSVNSLQKLFSGKQQQ
eukprot:TRINITY_DN778_c0_g2_i3.p1 TRINITY_DN778_c0_g2~~TRINITY_DN778_c0_g2_i3.p1  ORF type:complete len:741 (+),score=195.78 TRINITY_DN778_c0_g2_i3:100-2223(+)